ncbi:sensor histidine kinase [Brachybacterium kimchii]|uniref:histidine kinase n=1 Tax=Brachybacterium kimchii TaxID=2942909 RepID=A0ABY4N3N4_9MICO|nr:histidine kinase [Brachybacterium kimchii]UQN29175.1 histidine kinase [Brachybacterium kimchii]
MALALALAVFFMLTAWDVQTPALRAAAFGVVVLWAAEMVLGSLTDQYRHAGPRAIRVGTAALSVSQIAACALTFTTGSALMPVAIAGIVRLVRRPERRTDVMAVVLAADALALVGSALATGAKVELLIIFLLVCAGAALIGRFRAQRVRSADRERVLLQEQIAAQRERAENAALVERARIARDLHDVLAHSLGALTLQLDAAVALAEAGRFEELETRLRRARGLAADGLAESRDAVSALRETSREVIAGIEDAAAAHRDSGGEVHLGGLLVPEVAEPPGRGPGPGALRSLDPARADALLRAAQEMLTNARRHAPGREAALDLEAHGGEAMLRCRVRAAEGDGDGGAAGAADLIGQGPRAGSPGGGYGLLGMRERCEAVGGGASARLLADGTFETTASIPLTAAVSTARPSADPGPEPEEKRP